MANQRQFRSDDTSVWPDRYGSGSDGVGSFNTATDATPNTSFAGTGGGTAATTGSGTGFPNGSLVLIHQTQGTGAGNWELNKITSGGTTTSWTMAYTLMNTYGVGNAQVYLLKQYTTATINSGQTLTGQSWNGSQGGIFALLATQSITVAGNIVTTATGYRGGAGSLASGDRIGQQGESEATAAFTRSISATTIAGGGGTNTNGASGGGGGGYITSGGTGSPTAGGAGGAITDTDLIAAYFGGAGGEGGVHGNGPTTGTGGSGGGFVLLIAPTITVTGSISNHGGTGTNANVPGGGDATVGAGGGGGGAGGSVLFKGQVLTLGSTGALGANGGTGRNQTGSQTNETGGVGGDGRIHADYSLSISGGSTTPAVNPRQDATLASLAGGAFLFNML